MNVPNWIAGVLLLLGSVLCSVLASRSPLLSLVLWPLACVLFIMGIWGLITAISSRATRLELEHELQLQRLKQQQPSFQAVCPQCQMVIVHDGSLAGKAVSCGRCGSQFPVQ